MDTSKYCSKCRTPRPLSNFRKQNRAKDGHQYECRKCMNARARERYDAKKEELITKSANWQSAHAESHKEAALRHYHSPTGRIQRNIKTVLTAFFGKERPKDKEIIGLTTKVLIKYLTTRLKEPQTWDNYSKDWRIGFIKPLHEFNLNDESERRACFHWKNLTPVNKKHPDETDLV